MLKVKVKEKSVAGLIHANRSKPSSRKMPEQEKQKIIESKFNKQNIGELTGLKGHELDAFMNYCYLPEDFVLNASEYDVLVLIKNLYTQYRGHKKLWKNNPEKQ